MYISPRDAESNVEAEPSVEVEIVTWRTVVVFAFYSIAGIYVIVSFNESLAVVGRLGV